LAEHWSPKMNKIIEYVKEAYNELMNKVSWPTWPELQNSTTLVIIGSIIFALIVFVMDIISDTILSTYYDLF